MATFTFAGLPEDVERLTTAINFTLANRREGYLEELHGLQRGALGILQPMIVGKTQKDAAAELGKAFKETSGNKRLWQLAAELELPFVFPISVTKAETLLTIDQEYIFNALDAFLEGNSPLAKFRKDENDHLNRVCKEFGIVVPDSAEMPERKLHEQVIPLLNKIISTAGEGDTDVILCLQPSSVWNVMRGFPGEKVNVLAGKLSKADLRGKDKRLWRQSKISVKDCTIPTRAATLTRELKEETGIIVRDLDVWGLQDVREYPVPGRPEAFRASVFRANQLWDYMNRAAADVPDDSLTAAEPHAGAGVSWETLPRAKPEFGPKEGVKKRGPAADRPRVRER